MLQLINHIARLSAQRDRSKINEALVDSMVDLFNPQSLKVFRVYPGSKSSVIFDCAGIGKAGGYVRNAYLPETVYTQSIDADPLLLRCRNEQSVVFDRLAEDATRVVFYIAPMDRLLYLIDITIHEELSPERRAVLFGLIEYFTNHVALLDYGETDTLTGLPNRKTFDKHLDEVLTKATVDEKQIEGEADSPLRRKGKGQGSHWLAVFDIDHFKLVNDNHGHLIGD